MFSYSTASTWTKSLRYLTNVTTTNNEVTNQYCYQPVIFFIPSLFIHYCHHKAIAKHN